MQQVVGLTASPGAGNASTVDMAVQHILELCANMDVKEISIVRDPENLAEMMRHTQQAVEGMHGRLVLCLLSVRLTYLYRPRSRGDNTFGSVRVCVCVCPFVSGRFPV